jgi:hypothetical protein
METKWMPDTQHVGFPNDMPPSAVSWFKRRGQAAAWVWCAHHRRLGVIARWFVPEEATSSKTDQFYYIRRLCKVYWADRATDEVGALGFLPLSMLRFCSRDDVERILASQALQALAEL